MYEIKFVETMNEFLEHTQIISLLQDQMVYIKSPKTNDQLLATFKMVFESPNSHLVVISEQGHIVGFAFFNICIGMESAGKYIWLNEMHVHKDYRSRGIGSLLYKYILTWARNQNIVRLMGMAMDDEIRTKEFYKREGAEIYSADIISKKI